TRQDRARRAARIARQALSRGSSWSLWQEVGGTPSRKTLPRNSYNEFWPGRRPGAVSISAPFFDCPLLTPLAMPPGNSSPESTSAQLPPSAPHSVPTVPFPPSRLAMSSSARSHYSVFRLPIHYPAQCTARGGRRL